MAVCSRWQELFRLPYRQLEGLAPSAMQCLGLDLPVPDYTTLTKRAARLGGCPEGPAASGAD